jgi:hypothetical protein
MCLSGVQARTHLDSRLKHAGMTTFGRSKLWGMNPSEIQRPGLLTQISKPLPAEMGQIDLALAGKASLDTSPLLFVHVALLG